MDNDNKEKLEQAKYGYDQVNAWIANADNKVSISCGIFTGVFGVINFLADKYVKIPKDPVINKCWQHVYWFSLVISIALMGFALLYYVLAVNPKLASNSKKKQEVMDKKYPIYYGDICKLEMKQYIARIDKASDENLIEEIRRDTWYNAGICLEKMKKYKIALWLSFAGIAFSITAWGAHCLMYH